MKERSRRAAEDALLAERVRERTTALVQEIAQPLVDAGLVHVKWADPDPRVYADGVIDLTPANAEAAPVSIDPAPDWVTVCPGAGFGHEILIDEGGEWEQEVRDCLQAVIDGRYRESARPGRLAALVVTMTFERPEAEDIVVKHHCVYEGAGDEPMGERRYSSYR